MEYTRPIYREINARLLDSRGLIQVITGPRQVGKTTLVKQLFASSQWKGIYPIAENTGQYQTSWIESVFHEAELLKKGTTHQVILVIAEIQKIPNWSETIKRLYDK